VNSLYQAYGLRIRSELPLPELAPWTPPPGSPGAAGLSADADVRVRFGSVPRSLEGRTNAGIPWQVCAGRYLLAIDGVARFLITNGREVTIDPAPDAASEDIRLFFLGAVCGALLHTCGVLPLHGSSIATSRGALVFVGRSGSGKSTLLSALLRRGYTMIADDVTAVRSGGEESALAYPGYPRIRLLESVLRSMGEHPEALQRVCPSSDKRLLPANRFASTPTPIAALFELVEADEPTIRVEELTPAEQLARCSRYVRRTRLFPETEDRRRRFEGLAALLRVAPLKRILRPRHPFQPDALADFVERLSGQEGD
jgi:hypothetical protein